LYSVFHIFIKAVISKVSFIHPEMLKYIFW